MENYGSVYVLYDHVNKLIKIGCTQQANFKREKAIISSYPIPLFRFATLWVDNYKQVEKEVHQFLAPYQANSEYFSVSPHAVSEYIIVKYPVQRDSMPVMYAIDLVEFMANCDEFADKQAGKRSRFRVSLQFQLSKIELEERVYFNVSKETGEIVNIGKEVRRKKEEA